MDPYHEDPEFKAKCDELHIKAMEAGKSYYLDPQTGLRVATALSLWQRGYCCNSNCRHCAYGDLKLYEKYLKK